MYLIGQTKAQCVCYRYVLCFYPTNYNPFLQIIRMKKMIPKEIGKKRTNMTNQIEIKNARSDLLV